MRAARKHGFTLLEILVVLTAMVVLAGAAFFTLGRGNAQRSLDKGAETLHAMVRIARTQAIMNGTYSRLIINADSSDQKAYLRQVGVVIRDDENTGKWFAVDRGTYLPEGVFLVPQSGAVQVPEGLPRSVYKRENTDTTDGTSVFDYQYPLQGSVTENLESDPDWICIQFSPNGRLCAVDYTGGGLVPLSNQLILSRGEWGADKVLFSSPSNFVGIAFKRGGASYRSRAFVVFEDEEGV